MDIITMNAKTTVDAALVRAAFFGDATGTFLGRDRTPVIDPKSALVSDLRPAGPPV